MNLIRALLGVAWAELRTARRLARTWLFTLLSVAGGLLAYFGLTMLQLVASSQSPSFGAFQPRYLIAGVGVFVLWIFMIGLLFLAFDIRARDQRDRMSEVLDTRPVGNLVLLTGRLLGLVTTVWLPMVLLIGLMQGFGLLAGALELPFGDPLEPLSATAFLTIDALPMLILWCAMVFLLAVLIRNRLIVAIAAVALLGAHWWAVTASPYYLLPAISGLTGYTVLPSDVQPVFATASDVAQRLAELLLAAGMLILAAALHPRRDRGALRPQCLSAGVLLLAGALVIGTLAWQATNGAALRDAWREAHVARQDDAYADVVHVEGSAAIEPGRMLTLDLDYRLVAPDAAPLDELVMSLNPGMAVAELAVNGEPAPHTHVHGLLVAPLPTPAMPGESIAVSVRATGVPDGQFGYLDSVLDVPALPSDAGNLLLLGTQTGIFADAYVALMPAMRWLPMPGTATGRDDPGRYARDFFTVDLAVRTPPEWLVAGPGLREGQAGEYRFRPAAPLPSVALLAARFERRVADVGGTRVELLTSPKHGRNVEFFAEAGDAIRERLGGMLEGADILGLGYPYGGLSAVEIPAGLRSFGGGWRMASVQAMPGIVMLREYGFPSSRFEFPYREPERFAERQGGIGAVKADGLRVYFDNDITGGNPFHGAVRNLVSFQTGAVGEGALALDAMLHEMALRMLTKSRSGYFSPYPFATGADLGAMMQQAFMGVVVDGPVGSGSVAAQVRDGATGRAAVWDAALGASLKDLDPSQDSRRALDVLWLKVPAIAQSVLDAYGREAIGALLAELRQRYAGRNFTVAQFEALTDELGVPLAPVVGDWLHDAALPGFVASAPVVVRLPEDDQGRARYQVRVDVRNDEAVPGIVRLAANVPAKGGKALAKANSQAVTVAGGEAVELGLVIPGPPEELWLQPVLALNRRDVRLLIPEVEEYEVVDAEPFTGYRASDWAPPETNGIVVDDLDAGFSVRYDDEDLGLRVGGGSMSDFFVPDADIDQGLPVFSPFTAGDASWTRQEVSESFGKYRRTTARAPAGDGRANAVFTASLPRPGRWRIDYHLPEASDAFASARVRHGLYRLTVVGSGVEEAVEFDGAAAEWGWNDLGTFALPAGEVSLVVSNQTSGRALFADAVRWRPVDAD